MKQLIIILITLLTLNSCDDKYRKGVNGIKHRIYQTGVHYYYITSEIEYNGSCAKFKGFTESDNTPRDIVLCGNFVQEY